MTPASPDARQGALFPESQPRSPRALPVIGEQKDITYHGTTAKSVLNGPETTGMGFWSINPYIGCAFGCAYCYARYAHRYVMERVVAAEDADPGLRSELREMPAWLAFERHIVVKENAPAALRRSLRNGSAKHTSLAEGDTIVVGTATDPYQPAERRYRVTRGVLEVLAEHPGLSVVIITKSPLVTRDIDVLARIARHSELCVHLSLITLDRELARRIEPRAPTPESRVRALERLRGAGIEAGINCMPVLPGITDAPADLEALVKRVAQAGATYVGACALRLQSSARRRYLPFIAAEFPHLAESYRAAYASSHTVGERYREGLSRYMKALCRKYGVRASDYGESDGDEERETPEEAPGEAQLQLGF
ncbi:MAG: radical SAM protein [Gemmatimonadaceae bacterium]